MTWRHRIDTVAKLPSGTNKYFAASKERTFHKEFLWKLKDSVKYTNFYKAGPSLSCQLPMNTPIYYRI